MRNDSITYIIKTGLKSGFNEKLSINTLEIISIEAIKELKLKQKNRLKCEFLMLCSHLIQNENYFSYI